MKLEAGCSDAMAGFEQQAAPLEDPGGKVES